MQTSRSPFNVKGLIKYSVADTLSNHFNWYLKTLSVDSRLVSPELNLFYYWWENNLPGLTPSPLKLPLKLAWAVMQLLILLEVSIWEMLKLNWDCMAAVARQLANKKHHKHAFFASQTQGEERKNTPPDMARASSSLTSPWNYIMKLYLH